MLTLYVQLSEACDDQAQDLLTGRNPPSAPGARSPVEEFQMPEFATIFPAQVITVDEAPGVRGTDESWDDDDVIDSVLRLVADHHRAVGAAIGKRSFSPSLAELRQSPLGQDLRLLAMAGYGDVSRDQVQGTVGRVTDFPLPPVAG